MRKTFHDAVDAHEASEQSIWDLVIGPTAWAAHFALSYGTTALFCAKLDNDLTPARYAIAGYTVVALLVIGLAGLRSARTWGGRASEGEGVAQPGVEGRRRFIGFAALLLCTVSFVATLYGALPAAVFSTCR